MADQYAWDDRDRILDIFRDMQQALDKFSELAQEANQFKMAVMDNQPRLDELKLLMAEDPNWTLTDEPGQTSIQDTYLAFKAIYEYLNP